MRDLREYREIIKEAVRKEREADENWSWSVKAVNKASVKIGWGYLDYIGETDLFEIEIVDSDDNEPTVIGRIPNGSKVYCWVGPHHWNDCRTIGEAIVSVIHRMAVSAHETY